MGVLSSASGMVKRAIVFPVIALGSLMGLSAVGGLGVGTFGAVLESLSPRTSRTYSAAGVDEARSLENYLDSNLPNAPPGT